MAKPIPRAPNRSRRKQSADEFSGAQAVVGVPRRSPSADEPRRKRRRSTPLTQTTRDYLNRVELLTLVPLSMSSIDNLEKGGVFPSRFRLEPTTRVAWKRREVEKWLAERACKRVHHAPEKLNRPDRCDHFPTPDDLSRVS